MLASCTKYKPHSIICPHSTRQPCSSRTIWDRYIVTCKRSQRLMPIRTYPEASAAEPGRALSPHAADNSHTQPAVQETVAESSSKQQPESSTLEIMPEGPSSRPEPEQPTPAPPSPFAVESPAASHSQAANVLAGADDPASDPAQRGGPQSAEQLFLESPDRSILQPTETSRAGDGPIPNIELARFSEAASLSGSGLASFRCDS